MTNSIQKLVSENEEYSKKFEELIKERAITLKERVLEQKEFINGVNVYILTGEFSSDVVKNTAFMLRNEIRNAAFIAGYTDGGKPSLTLLYSDDLVSHGFNASKDIREAARFIEGGGGGQNFFATAGGKDNAGIKLAVDKLIELATKKI